ncbi:MAG: lyase family protein [Candidatus Woesearchaeota archaeon]|nr:lyase family protein [Candidatus Woesearchaeota archaeon]
MTDTLPKAIKPEEVLFLTPSTLVAGRYGTYDMVLIWGPERTFEHALKAQATAALLLAEKYPHIVSLVDAREIESKANLTEIDPQRIRELEAETGHDVIAINTALEEKVSASAASHINKARTSADTTQTARALQLKKSLEVIADSTENLRDILLEKAVEWIDVPHMDLTHGYDALPTVAGRAFAHYAEMIQSGLDVLKFVYTNSIKGKWGDATGNHHAAVTLGIDGIQLQKEYCDRLGIGFMTAAAQVQGREFDMDIWYALTRLGTTLDNVARYIWWGRSDDVNVFINSDPKKKKGSSAMPHKDAKHGNPTIEEQTMSLRNYLIGNLMTAVVNVEMAYARDLADSANSRINFEDGFKFLDHGIRNLAKQAYWITLREERCIERVQRSCGVVTAAQVMTYLTNSNAVSSPLSREKAHSLTAILATQAWESKTPFIELLLKEPEITSRISESTLRGLTDPIKFIGQSKEIIRLVMNQYHKKKTLA